MKKINLKQGDKCPCCGLRYLRNISVDAIAFRNNRVILVKRGSEPEKGFWALPGGMLDWDENIETAVLREFEEETGLRAEIGKFIGVYSGPQRHIHQTVTVAYEVKILSGRLKASSDAVEARWFRLGELPKLAFDHEKIIKDYKKAKIVKKKVRGL